MLRGVWAALALWGAAGCAGRHVVAESPARPGSSPRFSAGSRDRAVRLARSALGGKRVRFNGQSYPSDCTGFIAGVYDQLGAKLLSEGRRGDNGVTAIYRYAARHGRVFHGGRPLPGDLVFFRETYDQNRDGRLNDGLTHIGLVESVDGAGTVTLIHRVTRGVVRYRMNLAQRNLRRDPRTDRPLNDYLRKASARGGGALTAQLFGGYATLLPAERTTFASR
ncbi:MAG TPA: CHAP domain-containing protein [Myxococcaceae bacterium]|nr:CHAP domain-containing protein [Myxococcaceae bacterium]